MAQTPEGRVKDAVKKLLKGKGIWYYLPMQNGMGVVGIPDFICCWGGRFLAVETKAPGKLKNLTPNQRKRQEEIVAAHGMAVTVDSAEMLEEYLDGQQKDHRWKYVQVQKQEPSE
jgi:hypothetical protein